MYVDLFRVFLAPKIATLSILVAALLFFFRVYMEDVAKLEAGEPREEVVYDRPNLLVLFWTSMLLLVSVAVDTFILLNGSVAQPPFPQVSRGLGSLSFGLFSLALLLLALMLISVIRETRPDLRTHGGN